MFLVNVVEGSRRHAVIRQSYPMHENQNYQSIRYSVGSSTTLLKYGSVPGYSDTLQSTLQSYPFHIHCQCKQENNCRCFHSKDSAYLAKHRQHNSLNHSRLQKQTLKTY